ncbi:MAG: penicillin-binding transpeptidase domain-containing protein [Christensenellales bacterium]
MNLFLQYLEVKQLKNSGYSIGFLQKRLLVLSVLITFLFAIIVFRLGFIQLINGQWLQAKAVDQWTRDVPLKAKRGTVFDRNGNAIAISSPSYDVYVRARNVKDAVLLSEELSKILQLDFEKVYAKVVDRTVSETLIKMQVEEGQVQQIKDKNLSGVVLSQNNVRTYPYGDLFTQVLGFTTIDGVGQSGLEAYYNEMLTGINGTLLTQADVQGIELGNTLDYYLPSTPGMNITTTLDSHIQLLLEKAMAKALIEQKATKVTGIVMNPNTGEILAMGSKPSFDLNEVPRDNVSELMAMAKNMAVVDIYEPGSTFKIITSACALSEGVVTIDDSFYDPGYRIVDGDKIKCWKYVGHGHQNFTDGFCNSCNSVFIDLALRMGIDNFYNILEKFGIGQKTNVDFYGESSGIMMDKTLAKKVDLARMGFGQAIAVTPIQLITALSATVNGGNLMTPYLAKSIVDKDGNVVFMANEKVVRRVINEDVSATIRMFLEEAVSRPLGKYTFIQNYCVGGKTGTTQKYVNGAIAGTYIASFFGAFPCDKPDYVILFIVDEPTAGSYYGSIAASPYAKEVIQGIIDYKGYLPVANVDELEKIKMPNLVGQSLTIASQKLIELGLQYEIAGEGDFVISQFPSTDTEINKGQVIQINT